MIKFVYTSIFSDHHVKLYWISCPFENILTIEKALFVTPKLMSRSTLATTLEITILDDDEILIIYWRKVKLRIKAKPFSMRDPIHLGYSIILSLKLKETNMTYGCVIFRSISCVPLTWMMNIERNGNYASIRGWREFFF